MDTRELRNALQREFGGSDAALRVVVRQARDLADAGKPRRDRGHELSVDDIVRNLSEAPNDELVERWNWWMGSLETAYGGYDRFTVRFVEDGPDVNA